MLFVKWAHKMFTFSIVKVAGTLYFLTKEEYYVCPPCVHMPNIF